MGIVTKKGDRGTTVTLSGRTVSKADRCLEAVGTLDELTSTLGLARSLCRNADISGYILAIQNDLIKVGARLSCEEKIIENLESITQKNISVLEEHIRSLESKIHMPTTLSIPGASTLSAALDMSRAVARRLEREVVSMKETGNEVPDVLLIYLNRLSDLLYLMARSAETTKGAMHD